MKIKKTILGLSLISVMSLAVACGPGSSAEDKDVTVSTSEADLNVASDSKQFPENVPGAEENIDEASDEIQTADLETIAELLGTSDIQAAKLLGGGEENWTEDKTFFIGRIYHVKLFNEEVSVYTSYDDNQLVNSVSIWLVNGEREVKEDDVMQWEERINEFTGTKARHKPADSETGSKNWKWFSKDRAVTLNWMGDILTISMNVVVGELD